MCGRRNEAAYVADMTLACERILAFASGLSDSELMDVQLPHRGAVLHQFTILGEAAKYIDMGRRASWPGIPWEDITGMRDKLVHYYQGMDDGLVCDAVRTSIPRVLPQLRAMMEAMNAEKSNA